MGFRFFSQIWLSVYLLSYLAIAKPLLLSQVLKGKVLGSNTAHDIARKIVVAKDGSFFIAGTTTPRAPDGEPWGNIGTEEVAGKADIFLAKFSKSGKLIWVKRTGSDDDDIVNDIQCSNNALYICGSTAGTFGVKSYGSWDVFVMKFTLDGKKAWKNPYQFGSSQFDSCNALKVDEEKNRVYIVGWTRGTIFEDMSPQNVSSHYMIATLQEQKGRDDLTLLAGRQRGSHANITGDGLEIFGDHVLMMATETDDRLSGYGRTQTYLKTLDSETLMLHRLHVVNGTTSESFRGIDMVKDKNDSVIMVGESNRTKDGQTFHALKLNLTADDGRGQVQWVMKVGRKSTRANLTRQVPSIIKDKHSEQVYIAGVEDGFFRDAEDKTAGIVIVPVLKMNSSNGEVVEKWHRSTSTYMEKEELMSIALNHEEKLLFTGVWTANDTTVPKVLVGSFGSLDHPSLRPDELPILSGGNAVADAKDSGANEKGFSVSKVSGFIILSLGIVGIAVLAMFINRGKQFRGNSQKASAESTDKHFAEAHRDVLLEEERQGSGRSSNESNRAIGGSSLPS